MAAAGWVGYRLAPDVPGAPSPNAESVLRPGNTVVVALQQLARLEGAAFHLERVVDLKEKQTHFFGLVEAQDAILLVAAGDVTAGIDLSQLGEKDIQVDSTAKRVRLVLPHAQVFSSRVDNARTYVHTRTTDLLANRQLGLEAKAREEAERSFQQAAVDGGILVAAEKSATKTVHALLSSLGFTDIDISFREPSKER